MAPKPEKTPNPVDVSVGARIRLARKTQGLSQQALADSVGITFQQIQKYESGTNRVSASMLSKIASTLSVRIAEFFGTADGAGLNDEIAGLLGESGALDLLRSYSRLPRCYRSPLVRLAATLANA
jgi:transcriptional regulator with XRE-family HTH domain